ncbi:MAG: hypothetical protein QM736_03360 [Vicinamibacterales bacterium]
MHRSESDRIRQGRDDQLHEAQLRLDVQLRVRRRRGAAAAGVTTLHVISWYNNTSANKYNPDPRNNAGFGNRSVDEMAFSWMNVHSMTDDEFAREVAARAALRNRGTHD